MGRITTAIRAGLCVALAASVCSAHELKAWWCVPCFEPKPTNCDSLSEVRETNIREQRVTMVRFRDDDSLNYIVPEVGKECSQDSALFWIEPDSLHGTVGALLFRSVNMNGRESCHYTSYVFVVPMAHR